MQRAYYQAHIPTFLKADASLILGELTRAHGFSSKILKETLG